jgi:hypothetical protein
MHCMLLLRSCMVHKPIAHPYACTLLFPPTPPHPPTNQGAKIGVLGANGAGKSSLMRILAGVDESFEGRVVRVPGIRVGYLEQEPELADGATVAENIEPAVKHIRWVCVGVGAESGRHRGLWCSAAAVERYQVVQNMCRAQGGCPTCSPTSPPPHRSTASPPPVRPSTHTQGHGGGL